MHIQPLAEPTVSPGKASRRAGSVPRQAPRLDKRTQRGLEHSRRPPASESRRNGRKQCRIAARSQGYSTSLASYTVSGVDLSFDGWGQDGIREVVNEQALSVEDLIELADSCARQLHGEQELLIVHASLSHGEEHACSLDGSGCGPEMPEPASQACRLQAQHVPYTSKGSIGGMHREFHQNVFGTPAGQHLYVKMGHFEPDLDFDRSMDSWPKSHFAMVLWGAGIEQWAHDRQLAQQVRDVLTPGGVFMIPVRSSGSISCSSRAQLASSDFARQLLYSAGFQDIQAVQLTTLQGFTQSLPGDVMLAMGTRPGTAQGLKAANQASGLGYVSQSSIALSDLSNREGMLDAVQERWLYAYREMTEEAISIGIPKSVLPQLSEKTSIEELQDARVKLSGMIASFMSSQL